MDTKPSQRIVLVSRQHLLSDGFAQLLQAQEGWVWVDGFVSPLEALRRIPLLLPDIVLMEIQLPMMGGLELVRRLKIRLPDTPVVMLASDYSPDLVKLALQQGASGYLLKHQSARSILAALTSACQGGYAFAPAITESIFLSHNSFSQ